MLIGIILFTSALQLTSGSAPDLKLRNGNYGADISESNLRITRQIYSGQGYVPLEPNVPTSNLSLVKLGNTYYYFGKEEMNYFQATQFCREHKMDLLSIESKDENDLILDHLNKSHKILGSHFWTSGTDLNEEGKYIWLATGNRISFTQWHVRQPDNFLLAEHCVEILHDYGKYAWNDSLCSYKFGFICKFTLCEN